jgi:WD40 repeat protein
MTEQEIFIAAAQLPLEQRAEFLDAVCGEDSSKRNRLQRMLGDLDWLGDNLSLDAGAEKGRLDPVARLNDELKHDSHPLTEYLNVPPVEAATSTSRLLSDHSTERTPIHQSADSDQVILAESVEAPADSFLVSSQVRQRKVRYLLLLLISVALLGFLGTIAGFWQARSEYRRRTVAQSTEARLRSDLAKQEKLAQQRMHALRDRADALEREAKVRARLAQARTIRSSGRPGQRVRCLEEVAAAMKMEPSDALQQELATEATAALSLVDLRPVGELENWPSSRHAQFDVHLKRYFDTDLDGSVKVCDKNDKVLLRVPPQSPRLDRIAFSPHGKWLTAQQDGAQGGTLTRLWDLATGEELKSLEGSLIGMSDDHQIAVTWLSLSDGEMAVFQLERREELNRFKVGGGWRGMALSPDGAWLAVSGAQWLEFWMIARVAGLESAKFHQDQVPGPCLLAWDRQGKRVAAAGSDRRLYVWKFFVNRAEPITPSMPTPFSCIVFDPSSDLIATTSRDNTLRLWDAKTGQRHLEVENIATNEVHFSHDGRGLSTALSGDRLMTWQVVPNDECRTIPGKDPAEAHEVELSSDGRFLFHTTASKVAWWDVATREWLDELPITRSRLFLDPRDKSLLILGAARRERWAFKWKPKGDQEGDATLTLGPPQNLDQQLPVRGTTVFSANGCWALVDDRQHREIVSLALDDAMQQCRIPTAKQVAMAISNDGRWIATGANGDAKTSTAIWQRETGRLMKELPAADVRGEHVALAFTPDSQRLVTSTNEGVRVWDVETWYELLALTRAPSGSRPVPAAVAADGSLLACSLSPEIVQLFDLKTMREVTRLSSSNVQPIDTLRFSLDGGSLAAGREDATINVWNLRGVRQQLGRLGLDWNLPEIPPANASPFKLAEARVEYKRRSTSGRIKVPEVPAEDQAEVFASTENARELAADDDLEAAEALCKSVLRAQPGNLDALGLLTVIAIRGRRPQQAEAWFAPLLAVPPGTTPDLLADTCHTVASQILSIEGCDPRGIALARRAALRAVQLREAFQSADDDRSGTLARYLFTLAGAHALSGEREQGRVVYDRAVRWREEHAMLPAATRLASEQRAAAERLGLKTEEP